MTSPVFEKIQITDNEIANSPGPAAIFTSSRDFSFDGNAIFNANQVQTPPANHGALSTLDSVLVYNRVTASSAAPKGSAKRPD